ncbi:ABC transporter permease [Cryobacterium suzukii]|uniref:ABC transporter permease n=1 Tax=Cryobacterium suzukii TaxID=1259198 RepID=A0A4R9AIB1_9MICO|nr:ABC transporter permease [Cryobacterium suzukii]TFD62748.1 ABC transporter permease [Cryobacterium suzukii]
MTGRSRRRSRIAPFRAALRFARRDAWAAKGRSALIIAMVAIPVAGLSGVALVGLSMVPTVDETIAVELGQADARINMISSPDPSMIQSPAQPEWHQVEMDSAGVPVNTQADAQLVDPATLVPADSTLIALRSTDVTIETATGIAGMPAIEGETWNAEFEPKYALVDGRAPETNDEILVTAAALDRLGVGLGDGATLLDPERSVTVVGVLDAAEYPDSKIAVFGRLGAFTGDSQASVGQDDFYLFDHALDWPAVQQLNESGAVVLSKSVLLYPPPAGSYQLQASAELQGVATTVVTLTAAGVAFAVLEVALLAGAAFTVGARQQQRTLATVASVGGHRRTLFQIVTASGLVLGFAGGIAGVAIGVLAGSLFMAITGDGSAVQYWGYHLSIPILIGIALFAMLIGWIAALLPAWTASRLDVLAALRGARRPQAVRHTGRRWIGISIIVAGVAMTAGGALAGTASFSAPGVINNSSLYQLSIMLVLAGPVLAQVGALLVAPVILSALAALVTRLGTGARLAARDVVRNRSRSLPVLAAITTTVFVGTMLLAFFGGSDQASRASYERWNAEGQIMVDLNGWTAESTQVMYPIAPEVSTMLREQFDAEKVSVLSGVQPASPEATDSSPKPLVALRPEVRCEVVSGSNPAGACDAPFWLFSNGSAPQIWTGTVDDLALILDEEVSEDAQRALRAGGAVSLYPQYVQDDGTIQIEWMSASTSIDANLEVAPLSTTTIDAVVQQPAHPIHFGVFMLESTATAHGLEPVAFRVLASLAAPLDDADYDQLWGSLRSLTGGTDLVARYEAGPGSTTETSGWALVAVAALVAFGAAAVALGLARADGRRDDVTLSAVGAHPGLRRNVAFWQAVLLTGTGAVLGGILGLLGPTMLGLVGLLPFAPPWPQVALLVLGLPVIIAVGSWLFTRPAQFEERLQRTLT